MITTAIRTALVLVVFFFPGYPFAQKLQGIRDAASGDSSSGSTSGSSDHSGHSHGHYHGHYHGSIGMWHPYHYCELSGSPLCTEVADQHPYNPIYRVNCQGELDGVPCPFFVYHVAEKSFYTDYPYASQEDGSMIIENETAYVFRDDDASWTEVKSLVAKEQITPRGGTGAMVRIGPEYAYDLGKVHRPGIYIQFDHARTRFGFEGSFTTLVEQLEKGKTDTLPIGDANLTLRLLQRQSTQIRCGVGLRFMFDDESFTGFNGTCGIDLFPTAPLVVQLVGDLGTLGEAMLAHARVSVGASFRGWEPYLGFDALRIGTVNLYGPAAGLRYWF